MGEEATCFFCTKQILFSPKAMDLSHLSVVSLNKFTKKINLMGNPKIEVSQFKEFTYMLKEGDITLNH